MLVLDKIFMTGSNPIFFFHTRSYKQHKIKVLRGALKYYFDMSNKMLLHVISPIQLIFSSLYTAG